MKTAIMIKTNLIGRDSRVLKERDALREAGYGIRRLCWNRDGQGAPSPGQEDDDEEKRLNLKSPWGIKILPFLPVWWIYVFFHLLVEKWDIAQAINLDSAIPAILAGKIKGKPVIYEIEDAYEDEVPFPSAIRYLFIKFDRFFMRLAAAVILVDETQIEEFGSIPNRRATIIYDSPPDVYGKVEPTLPDGVFTLLYDGTLAWERDMKLENIWEVVKGIEGARLVITGFGNMVPEIRQWCLEMPEKVTFLGWVNNGELMQRSFSSDLLLALRSSRILTDKFNCGSKVLKAMMCGKPSLVVKETSSAKKVVEANCGLAIDINDVQNIREAIIKLKNSPELRRELGSNGRKAYEQKYYWGLMKQRLLSLYALLLGGKGGKKSNS